jgi:DNA-directed RNA polymerase subunit N (RpoN/RPB10)
MYAPVRSNFWCVRAAAQVFADYKTRGPVILKPSDTAELIEKLEDSQMQLGSMATNRYICLAELMNVVFSISSVHAS